MQIKAIISCSTHKIDQHKKYSSDSPSNYRPISILSVFSKIFDKLMYKRLLKFLDTCEIFSQLQLAFVKNIELFMPFYLQLTKLSFLLIVENLVVEFFLIFKKHLTQLTIRFYFIYLNNMVLKVMF